jgi:Protein of unknown function (DUF4058)
MPLLDHFHPPISNERNPQSVHTAWLGALLGYLNLGRLPPGYLAQAEISVGSRLEVDVAALERPGPSPAPLGNGGTATLTAPVWTRPVPALSLPILLADATEVLVYKRGGSLTLVTAIELISESNKDRPEERQAFAAKCATFLHHGVGLVIIDIITNRRANLHDQIMRQLGQYPAFAFPSDTHLYTVSYEPLRSDQGGQVDIWPQSLALGQALPTVPLPLRGHGCIPLELEPTYTEARLRNGL